jgi:hypothetical protein
MSQLPVQCDPSAGTVGKLPVLELLVSLETLNTPSKAGGVP